MVQFVPLFYGCFRSVISKFIQTFLQNILLAKTYSFGHFLVVDASHHTNNYHFQLCSVFCVFLWVQTQLGNQVVTHFQFIPFAFLCLVVCLWLYVYHSGLVQFLVGLTLVLSPGTSSPSIFPKLASGLSLSVVLALLLSFTLLGSENSLLISS